MIRLFPTIDFGNEKFPFSSMQEGKIGNVDIRLLRVSFAGELGWELHIPPTNGEEVYDKIFETAKGANVHLKDGGMWALLNCLRIEKGFVHNGHDLYPLLTPAECGLAFTVDFKKKDFVGKKALQEKKKVGPRKRLVSFTFDNTDVSPHGHYAETIYRDNELVGYLTSAGYSHTIDKPFGLGFVSLPKDVCKKPKKWIEKGNYEIELVKDCKIVREPVKVSFSCIVDPKGLRAQGQY